MLLNLAEKLLLGFIFTALAGFVIGVILVLGLGLLFFIFLISGLWLIPIGTLNASLIPVWGVALVVILIYFFGQAAYSSVYPEG